MQGAIDKLNKKTDRRLESIEAQQLKIEKETKWKIIEYEKLLQARPTMPHMKSLVEEGSRNAQMEARVYTDAEIAKIKSGGGGGGDNNMMEIFN